MWVTPGFCHCTGVYLGPATIMRPSSRIPVGRRSLQRYLIKLLRYPRWVIFNGLDLIDCPQNGFFASADMLCRRCEFGPECNWLNNHEEGALSNRSIAELAEALAFAVDYVRRNRPGHRTRRCSCDWCSWLRDSNRMLKRLRRCKAIPADVQSVLY